MSAYRTEYGEMPEYVERDLASLLSDCGYSFTVEGGRTYVCTLSDSGRERVSNLLEEAFASGASVVSYDKFYRTYENVFTELSILSVEQFRAALAYYFGRLVFEGTYFSPENTYKTIEEEIAEAYNEGEVVLSLEELARRLPYLEPTQIQTCCSQRELFISGEKGEFALYERIRIDREDVQETIRVFDADIEERGFSKIERAVVESSLPLNMDVPEKTVQLALYQRFLTKRYDRKRDIITEPGYEVNFSAAFADFCETAEEATLDELEAFEVDLTGRKAAINILPIAWERMARIDQDRFISLESFQFDDETIEMLDNAIALFVKDGVAPISSITSFSSFPHVDFEGAEMNRDNLFLLESYCRFASKRYRSLGRFNRKKAIGAIYSNNLEFQDYDKLLVYVVAHSDLPLEEIKLGEWLVKKGYVGRKSDLEDVINQARRMREQKESE